jgi:hypothetical protein
VDQNELIFSILKKVYSANLLLKFNLFMLAAPLRENYFFDLMFICLLKQKKEIQRIFLFTILIQSG